MNIYSHTFQLVGKPGTDCTSMLCSIDSCQNRLSADQYNTTVSRAQVSTHRGRVFFEGIRWQVTSFQMIVGSSLFLLKFIWNMIPAPLCSTTWIRKTIRFILAVSAEHRRYKNTFYNIASYIQTCGGKTRTELSDSFHRILSEQRPEKTCPKKPQ